MGTLTSEDSPGASAADVAAPRSPAPPAEAPASAAPDLTALLVDLEQPGLVLSNGYIGPDRRSTGPWWRLRRAAFGTHRRLLSLETSVVAVAVVAVVGFLVLSGTVGAPGLAEVRSGPPSLRTGPPTLRTGLPSLRTGGIAVSSTAAPSAPSSTVAAPSAVPSAGARVPLASTTEPTTAAPAATVPASPVTTAPAVAATTASPTPDQLGAEALSQVRYPWQSIPGYSIRFLPIGDAPSPGFLGNTSFTWGRTGGVSSLYVYPGESVQKLAGIIAFEIGHEVDAASVEPQGGEAAIEAILGIHPASWAPNCDCSEQGFLSGWYAAAFSNYWSPGVGNWSPLAPEPSGPELAAVEPWLNPTIP